MAKDCEEIRGQRDGWRDEAHKLEAELAKRDKVVEAAKEVVRVKNSTDFGWVDDAVLFVVEQALKELEDA